MSADLDDFAPDVRALVERWLEDPALLSEAERERLWADPERGRLLHDFDAVRTELERRGATARAAILAEAAPRQRPLRFGLAIVAVAAAALLALSLWSGLGGTAEPAPLPTPDPKLGADLGLTYELAETGLSLEWRAVAPMGVRVRISVLDGDGAEVDRLESESGRPPHVIPRAKVDAYPRPFYVLVELVSPGNRLAASGSVLIE
ncbi:MAG: hypothetical protein AAF628_22320 [Planctomycetota bacterium]